MTFPASVRKKKSCLKIRLSTEIAAIDMKYDL